MWIRVNCDIVNKIVNEEDRKEITKKKKNRKRKNKNKKGTKSAKAAFARELRKCCWISPVS